MSTTLIANGNVILKDRVLNSASVEIFGQKISHIGKKPAANNTFVIDAKGCFVSPGFIDTNIHGSPEEIMGNETRYGTTSFVAAVSCGRPVPRISGYRNVLGIRMEGPYISKKMAGAQDRRFIKTPSVNGLLKTIKQSEGAVKMITIAPELDGAAQVIKMCKDKKIILSIGHSAATYAEAAKMFSSGVKHATHIFNAMSGPRHGSAGASMAAVFDDSVYAEVIADMKHVKKELLRLLFTAKPKTRTILITDSVRARSSGHKKGSNLTMIGAIKNVVKYCGVDLQDAVSMASLNPARLFGVSGRKGSIGPGKDADLVIFDKNFDVKMTMIRGKIVYCKKGFVCAA